jgi:hypothetical protein
VGIVGPLWLALQVTACKSPNIFLTGRETCGKVISSALPKLTNFKRLMALKESFCAT